MSVARSFNPGTAFGCSRCVTSSQEGVHRDLERLVRRHLAHPFLRPIGEVSRRAVDQALEQGQGRPLILDSGCGVGESTAALGERFPDAWVIGIDKSAARLGKAKALPANAVVIRADLVDAWRQLRGRGVRLSRHFLLYPNPWPKVAHLARRWHGHPVFPDLLALGGGLELRSNWQIYVEEMCVAVAVAGVQPATTAPRWESFEPNEPLTPFERKYRASGHALYRVQIPLMAEASQESDRLMDAAE